MESSFVGLCVASVVAMSFASCSKSIDSGRPKGSAVPSAHATTASSGALHAGSAVARLTASRSSTDVSSRVGAGAAIAAQAYHASLAESAALDYEGLLGTYPREPGNIARLSFDPTKADYYRLVASKLALTGEERAKLKQQGFVQLDNRDGLSMAEQYLAIYVADLPVLITTDSILDVLHRSYDRLLEDLEIEVLLPTIEHVLTRAHREAEKPRDNETPLEKQAKCDASLYLSVALSLFAAKDAARSGGDAASAPAPVCNQTAMRDRILEFIESERMQLPGTPGTSLYGDERYVDYSQFRPRGHYATNPALEAYFRGMMWLGREDTGMRLTNAGQGGGQPANATREAAAATMLSHWLAVTHGLERLVAIDRVLSVLVDQAEFLGPDEVMKALQRRGVTSPKQAFEMGQALPQLLVAASPVRAIRSQMTTPDGSHMPDTAPYDATFQLLGQRFLIDSMVLSKVVYDSTATERMIPSGLDVMAALGNLEAASLLRSELTKFRYAPQLLGAKRAVEAFYRQPPTSFHHRWLAALGTLHRVPKKAGFPESMRTAAWQRKVLQTQLAAWAQVRRDNVLYSAQSYSAVAICDYPKGYVEPYPLFFNELAATLATLSEAMRQLETAAVIAEHDTSSGVRSGLATEVKQYVDRARELLLKLGVLAQKELDRAPFTAAENAFLKNTIQSKLVHAGCTTSTLYTGWYVELSFRSKPVEFEPVIADVHSSQAGFLEEGVGHNELLVVAIDNGVDRAVYVGPTYTHYQFVSPERLTDVAWRERLTSDALPPRPSWIGPLVGPPPNANTRRPRLQLP